MIPDKLDFTNSLIKGFQAEGITIKGHAGMEMAAGVKAPNALPPS